MKSTIKKYNQQQSRDEDTIDNFIIRHTLFDKLIMQLSNYNLKLAPQHMLFIGHRGMGKSTFLKRIEVELRLSEKLNKKFVPLLFPEEQYGVHTLSLLFANALDALANYYEKNGHLDTASEIDQLLEKQFNSNEKANAEFIWEKIIHYEKQLSKRFIFIIDNLNLIFQKLNEEDQHNLREKLTRPEAPIVIGSSVTNFNEITDYKLPFYEAFTVHSLYKVDFEEMITLLKELSKKEGTDNDKIIDENLKKLEVFHQLTGGNPRTLVYLLPLIREDFAEQDTYSIFEILLDEITPLYKARMEELTGNNQVVLNAIALNWDTCNLDDLRKSTQLESNQISPVLGRLLEGGWIHKADSTGKKNAYYEVSERFFSLWCLMRLGTRKDKNNLRCLAKFLEAFVTDKDKWLDSFNLFKDTDDFRYGLAMLQTSKLTVEEREKVIAKCTEMMLKQGVNNLDIEEVKFKEEFLKKEYRIFVNLCNQLKNEKKYKEAIKLMNHAKEEFKTDLFYLFKSLIYAHMEMFEEADNALELVSNRGKKKVEYYICKFSLLYRLGRFLESLPFFELALEMNFEFENDILIKYADLAFENKRDEIAEKLFAIIYKRGNMDETTLFKYIVVLNRNSKNEKALEIEDILAESGKDILEVNLINFSKSYLQKNFMKAKSIMNHINKSFKEFTFPEEDEFVINTLLELQNKNWGAAKKIILEKKILKWGSCNTNLFPISIQNGFGQEMLQLMQEQNMEQTDKPLFEAVKAIVTKDESHLKRIAAEARPAARKIYDEIMARLKK